MKNPSRFSYHIQFQEKKGIFIELVFGNQKKKSLYIDELKKHCASCEEEIVKELISLHRKNNSISSLDCLTFNKIELPMKKSLLYLKKLSTTGNLFWKSKKIHYFPLKLDLFFEIEEKIDQTATALLCFRKSDKTIFPEKILLASGYLIADSTLYEIDRGLLWLESYLEIKTLSKERKEDFLSDLEEEKIPFELKKSVEVEKTPLLFLKDQRGVYSEVGVEYKDIGHVPIGDDFQSDKLFVDKALRDSQFEGEIIKDLMELSWVKKEQGYYLPLDLLEENLHFLLEMGWKIFDFRKREVSINNKIILDCSLKDDIEIKATLDGEELDITLLCQENALFASLEEGGVTLLDSGLKQKLKDLLSSASKGEKKLLLKKEQFGDLLEKSPYIKKDLNLQALCDKKTLKPSLGNFTGTLFPYQEKGLLFLHFLYENGFGGILADEMGLGKTVQVLAFLSSLDRGPHLICVPATLIFNWKNEISRFLKDTKLVIHHGPSRKLDRDYLLNSDIVITTYQTLRQDSEFFQTLAFDCVILDEAMVIKNPKSKVYEAVNLINSSFHLCITATPIENRLEELLSLFSFVMPALVKKLEKSPFKVGRMINPFVLRRLKSQVDIELPEKIEQDVWIEMTTKQKTFMDQFLEGKKEHLAEKNSLEILTLILRLRQISCHPYLIDKTIEPSIEYSAKLQMLFKDLEEIFLEKHKVIVYSQFTSLLTIVEKEAKERGITALTLSGKTSTKEREKRVQFFQQSEENALFLISLKAGGVGLNLTEADYVYLLDPFWNDKVEAQAIDRAHRIGQKRKVVAKRLYSANSIEESIYLLKKEKSSLFEKVLSSEQDLPSLKKEDLLRLFD